MAATVTAENIGVYGIKYTWTGTAPFDVWVNGEKILNQTTATEYIDQFPSAPVSNAVEIRDADDTGYAQSEQYSSRLRIQWRGQNDADFYKIQKYVDSAWVTQQIINETGIGYYSFTTIAQPDATTVQWRVLPVDSRAYEGDPITFTHLMVCNPATPDVTFSYDPDTGNLTVAATS